MNFLGFDVNETDINEKTAIYHMYQEENYEQIQYLAQNLKAQIDRPMLENGKTLLMDAAMRGNQKMFNFLLRLGANRDLRCNTGRQVIDYIKMEFAGKNRH